MAGSAGAGSSTTARFERTRPPATTMAVARSLLDDGHPQDRLVHRHRRPGLQHVEERLGPERQLAFGAQRLLPHQPDGLSHPQGHPGGHQPHPHLGALGVEADRQVGMDPGGPEHVLHVAEGDVREVEPEEVDALRSEAAQHRRPQRRRPQGDDELRRPFLRHVRPLRRKVDGNLRNLFADRQQEQPKQHHCHEPSGN